MRTVSERTHVCWNMQDPASSTATWSCRFSGSKTIDGRNPAFWQIEYASTLRKKATGLPTPAPSRATWINFALHTPTLTLGWQCMNGRKIWSRGPHHYWVLVDLRGPIWSTPYVVQITDPHATSSSNPTSRCIWIEKPLRSPNERSHLTTTVIDGFKWRPGQGLSCDGWTWRKSWIISASGLAQYSPRANFIGVMLNFWFPLEWF